MRGFLAIVLTVFWAGFATAQEVLPPEPGIQSTIDGQLSAFQSDDFAKAFTFASPNIQGMFGNSERFGQMVRQGYPMVWRPADVQFGELRQEQGLLWQKVVIQDQRGTFYELDYQMVPGEDGWLINGVHLVRTPQVGA